MRGLVQQNRSGPASERHRCVRQKRAQKCICGHAQASFARVARVAPQGWALATTAGLAPPASPASLIVPPAAPAALARLCSALGLRLPT
eukprot:COSAG04_NODE_467_length_13861_cov_24.064889_6_plen_89_part_00